MSLSPHTPPVEEGTHVYSLSLPFSDSSSPPWLNNPGLASSCLNGWLTGWHTRTATHTHIRLLFPVPSLTPGFLPLHCSLAPRRITAVCQAALFLSIHPIVTTLSSPPVPPEASNLGYILAAFCTSLSFRSPLLNSFSLTLVSLCSPLSSYLFPPLRFYLLSFYLWPHLSISLSCLRPAIHPSALCGVVYCCLCTVASADVSCGSTEKTVTGSEAYSKPCWLASLRLADWLAGLATPSGNFNTH